MFEELEKQVLAKGTKQEFVNVDFSSNPTFNPQTCRELVKNLDKYTDQQIFEILSNSYKTLLEDVVRNKDKSYDLLIINTRFLSILYHVLVSTTISETDRVYINSIAYDYLSSGIEPDAKVKQMYLQISKLANRDMYPSLLGIGLDENLAALILLSRFSNIDNRINVMRVNFIITQNSEALMTTQMVIDIYDKIFTTCFGALFKGTMFDVYTLEELESISYDANEVYGNITNAVLIILESLPERDIRKVLIDYANTFNVSPGLETRTSLRCISVGDHPKIHKVIDMIAMEQIIVP